MHQIIIVGAGGHGSEVACYVKELERAGQVTLLGFIDDGKPVGPMVGGEVLGTMEALHDMVQLHPYARYITAFGNNALRLRVVSKLASMGLPSLVPATVVSLAAWSGLDVNIGEGTCVAPGAVLTSRVTVGRHCIINVKASLAHDTVVGDYCNINPSATICGNVTIGEGSFIGAGATVIEKRKIGAWTIIGAGSVVTQDLPDGVTAVGVPARIIKRQGIPPQS